MILYGASGHAKVIIDCIHSSGGSVTTIFDDDKSIKELKGIPVFDKYEFSPEELLVSIGDNLSRKKVVENIQHNFGVAKHPSANISESVSIGRGSVFIHECIVQSDVKIGNHNIINTAAVVEHDCQLGDYVHIAPKAIICGGVTIGEGTLIGAGAIVKPGVVIGDWSIIGAGAVVINDVPNNTTVVGNPAKELKKQITNQRIYLSPPHMGGHELKYIYEAFDKNQIAPLGDNIDAFENELSNYLDGGYVVGLSSGTAAIHLALKLVGVEEGDVVICPTFTFVASVNPIFYLKAKPIFIDSETETWNMSPELLEKAIVESIGEGKKPKAIIVVHLYGQSAKLDEILSISDKYDVPVIEDAAESLGASYNEKKLGRYGRIGVYSFNGNKIITTSGGGALVSDDKMLIEKAKYLATQAKEELLHYEHLEVGYNYRMSNISAGIGRCQLKVLDEYIEKRKEINSFYKKALKGINEISFNPLDKSNYWLTCIVFNDDSKVSIETLREALEQENIESRVLWKPMHLQPVFKGSQSYTNGVSEGLFKTGLCLPSGSSLTEESVLRIAEIIKRFFQKA